MPNGENKIKNSKRITKIRPLLFISLVVLVLSLAFTIRTFIEINSYSKPFESETLEAEVTIAYDRIGFDVSSDGLRFGKVVPNSFAEKNTVITNNNAFPVYIKITCEGAICELMNSSLQEAVLLPRETVSVRFVVEAKEEHEKGEYAGRIRVEYYKVFEPR
ncbi:MAG TPA: hypothetical protein ENN46_04475 [Candidatus Woesearchaeota archaeon]|nr:hypothetical protein [Candidatus Woesearchaeota archaeon]